jgi:hypothetical protein
MPLLLWSLPLIVFTGVWETYFGDEGSSARMVRQKAVKPVPRRDSRRPRPVPF